MSEAVDKLTEVERYIESLKVDTTDAEEKLAKLREQITDAAADKDKTERNRDIIRVAAAEERQKLKAEIDAITYKRDILLGEQKDLEEKVASFKVQTTEMSRKIAEFKTYESRAMQVLRTKEASLVEREKAVREQESLSPLLPER